MNKIQTFLWFDANAEAAVDFYKTIFEGLVVREILTWGPGMPEPEGKVLTISFEVFGQQFVALNGGPHHSFNPSISFMIACDTQEEIDRYWNGLLDGGQAMACGWVSDRFGVAWQVTPRELLAWIADPDMERRQRVMTAMMGMVKLDLAELRRAHQG